jgi:hypothetical protein
MLLLFAILAAVAYANAFHDDISQAQTELFHEQDPPAHKIGGLF